MLQHLSRMLDIPKCDVIYFNTSYTAFATLRKNSNKPCFRLGQLIYISKP